MSPRLEVIPASPADQPALANLIELYIHDFSEFVAVDIGEDGRFGYPNLALYFRERDHHAHLARIDGKLAGFALLRRIDDAQGQVQVWDMAEFWILRRYRRQGAGAQLARSIWNLYPGEWQVRVMEDNSPAVKFWASAISGVTGRPAVSDTFVADDRDWRRFRFRSPE
ncbi:MAG TPA: GNAT family N-acetyltransferase [Terracidiphilus sp.]|jgi:predicted acetyltransferase